MVWAAPGQLARVSPTEAMAHLRADLLPPPSAGPPVLPFTAHAGAAVQLAYGFWDPPSRQRAVEESSSRGAATMTTASGDAANVAAVAALQDAVDKKAAKAVIGILLEQVCELVCEVQARNKAECCMWDPPWCPVGPPPPSRCSPPHPNPSALPPGR